jgi:hypothetical protein
MSEINNGSKEIIQNIIKLNEQFKGDNFKEIKTPKDYNVCLNCPNAMWFFKSPNLKNYCRVMNTIEYSNLEDKNMRFCAGKNIS